MISFFRWGSPSTGPQGLSASGNAEGPRPQGVEAVFLLAGAQRRGRMARPRAIHINEKKGGHQMRDAPTQGPLVLYAV